MFFVQKYFEEVFWFWRLQNTKYMQKSNLNTSQGINTGKVFKIQNTMYIYSILSSNLNTCILNTDQHWWQTIQVSCTRNSYENLGTRNWSVCDKFSYEFFSRTRNLDELEQCSILYEKLGVTWLKCCVAIG